MDRIAIVGCGGSGKSCLAWSLGSVLGVTPVHLDGLYYDQNWKPLDQDRFAALQRDLVAAPRWISCCPVPALAASAEPAGHNASDSLRTQPEKADESGDSARPGTCSVD